MATEKDSAVNASRQAIKKSSPLTKALIALVVVLLGGVGYLYTQYSSLKADPQKVAQEEAVALTALVSKLIVLPANEIPTVATVTEPEKLQDQAFFAGAKKGDKVLIYTNAKKAILYDPVLNKLIQVAPINIGAPTTAQEKKPEATPAVTATESTRVETSDTAETNN